MRNQLFLFILLTSLMCGSAHAAKGIPASQDAIVALKDALSGGIIQIGKTRLKEIQEVYGEATNIDSGERRVTYNYGDLRIEFDKRRLWREWDYDSFKDPAYTDDIDDLRFDLESEELVGNNITLRYIRREYGEPTEMMEKPGDGEHSIYYYGDIKMIFENYYVVRSWRSDNLQSQSAASSGGVLSGSFVNSNGGPGAE